MGMEFKKKFIKILKFYVIILFKKIQFNKCICYFISPLWIKDSILYFQT